MGRHAPLVSFPKALSLDMGSGRLTLTRSGEEIAAYFAGVPVLVDPKGTNFHKYRGASLLTPNQSEFEAVAGRCASDQDLVDRARTMMDDLDLDALLVTRSEKGMLLVEAGVDMAKPDPYLAIVAKMNAIMDEMERLLDELE